jgi:hypothetical protein
MSVFICCADESSDGRRQDEFFYGGFAAPIAIWDDDVIPAWTNRVLAGPPAIEYLHMADVMRPEWRQKEGLSWWDIDDRVTEASRVIGSSGGLIPIVWSLGHDRFQKEILPYAPRNAHTGLEEPDYLAFLCFAYSTLAWLREFRSDEADRVDFWVERNGKISTRLGRFHERIPNTLTELGRSDLAAMCGDFLPVSKTCIQAQAADMLCWHERNASAETLDTVGWRRRARMVGNRAMYGCSREGFRSDVADMLFAEFTKSLARDFQVRRPV